MKHSKKLDTDEKTSKRMANVKLKRGDVETILARKLWHRGIRYRLNFKSIPGSPDVAITKYKIAVFIDGEFWHGYDWENKKSKIGRNKEYWIEKIEENISRDKRNDKDLIALGWTPVHFWSKEVLNDVEGCVRDIEELIIQSIYH